MAKQTQQNIETGVYVIGNDGRRNWLMQVSSCLDSVVYGTLDKDRAYSPTDGEFNIRQIVAVLGPNPHAGNAYGCQIEPYERTLIHPQWNNVHWFVRMPKPEKTALKTSLDRVAKLLTSKRLFGFVAGGELQMEIRPPRGKYTGMYHFVNKDGGPQDRMILRPKMGVPTDYVVAHESGHGVYYRLMTDQQRARWIRLYHSYMKMQAFEPADIERLRDAYIEENQHVKDFRGQLEESDVLLFDNLIGTLCGTTRLTTRHLNELASDGSLETIRESWPVHVDDSDFEIVVSEYGSKNPEEFFAEAFAFWLLGNKLPKRVLAAMEKTVANVKR